MTRPAKGTYRPDIDGLRAIAVVSVIVYHFNASFLASGFVGVDIFFVISGFVVTKSVLAAEESSWPSETLRFWRRRFLRIFPALAVFVAITLLAAAIFLPPFPDVPYTGNVRTGVASLLGVSNLYLFRIQLDYFQDVEYNLFVHTWSLGVEEQFYLTFSVLFIALARGLSSSPAGLRRARLIGVGLLTVCSYGLLLLHAGKDPAGSYYLLQYRLWELGLGCLLALAPIERWRERLGGLTGPVQVVAGVLLAASMLAPSAKEAFPVAPITVAVLMAAALIVTGAGKGRAPPIAALLSRPLFVGVGLISYSLYLWHWPVLILFKTTVGLNQPAPAIGAFATMGVLAVLSYRLVELRWSGHGRRLRQALPYAIGLAGAALALAAAMHLAPGALYAGRQQDWRTDWRRPDGHAYAGVDRVTFLGCHLTAGASIPDRVPPTCISPPAQAGEPRKVLLVGDSQAQAAWGMLSWGEQAGAFGFETLTHDGCMIQGPRAKQSESCRRYWSATPQFVREALGPGDAVLVVTAWDTAPPRDDAAPERIEALAAAAREVGARLVVQTRLPTFGRATWLCTPEWFRVDYTGCATERARHEQAKAASDAFLRRQTGVHVWDPTDYLCQERLCAQFQDGRPIFRDYIHLSDFGARGLGPPFAAFLEALSDRPPPAPAGASSDP